MPYLTPDTAITGNIITAADGNRRRDNDEYFKGRAGLVSIENSVAVTGTVSASAGLTGPTVGVSGAGAMLGFSDRSNPALGWAWYADAGLARLYSQAIGDILQFAHGTGNMNWTVVNDPDSGIPPQRLRRVTRIGMLGAGGGTQSIAYNADGTVNWIHFPDGISAVSTLTFEYSAGRVVAIRLRVGDASGTIINSVAFGYDGTGRVISIAQS